MKKFFQKIVRVSRHIFEVVISANVETKLTGKRTILSNHDVSARLREPVRKIYDITISPDSHDYKISFIRLVRNNLLILLRFY